jgi:hypothetical protein
MIDFIILEQMTAFAVIMQKHPGWVGQFLLFRNICSSFNFVSILNVYLFNISPLICRIYSEDYIGKCGLYLV